MGERRLHVRDESMTRRAIFYAALRFHRHQSESEFLLEPFKLQTSDLGLENRLSCNYS